MQFCACVGVHVVDVFWVLADAKTSLNLPSLLTSSFPRNREPHNTLILSKQILSIASSNLQYIPCHLHYWRWWVMNLDLQIVWFQTFFKHLSQITWNLTSVCEGTSHLLNWLLEDLLKIWDKRENCVTCSHSHFFMLFFIRITQFRQLSTRAKLRCSKVESSFCSTCT